MVSQEPKISHLKVFEALRDEVLDPQRQLQLINLLLVGELGEHGGAATILKRIRGFDKKDREGATKPGSTQEWKGLTHLQ